MKTGFSRVGAFAACALFLVLNLGTAEAAGRPEKPKLPAQPPAVTAYSSSKSPATAEPATTGSIAPAAEEDANCTKSRKRLWVEGEGWVVRRVTTCF